MTTKVLVSLRLTVVVLAAMLLTSCDHYVCGNGATFGSSSCTASGNGLSQGGGSNSINVTSLVYFVDPSTSGMALEALNFNGSQTYAPVSSFAAPTVNVASDYYGMAISQKTYLYITSTFPDLYAFSINSSSGDLTALSGSPYAIAGGSVVADPAGRFLFVGGAAGIYVFTINTDGSLTEAAGSPFSNNGIRATQLVTDGSGKYLYALGGAQLTQFSYNQTTGVLTSLGELAPGLSNIESEPSGKYILGITGNTADVHVYSISSTGTLAELSNSPFATVNAPVSFAVDPTGTYVYTFNQNGGGPDATLVPMEGYTLGSDGSLTALSTSPFTGLNASMGLFDQSGQYLFTVAQPANSTIEEQWAYTVDTTTGAVSSNLPSAGAVGVYVVTDVP